MKDTLYEVVLTPTHIDTIHASLITQEMTLRGMTLGLEQQQKQIVAWADTVGVSTETARMLLHNCQQTLKQFEKLVAGTEIEDEDKELRLCFHEAFDPFEPS